MAHILVVEDEQHLADGIKFNLQAEGYQVTAVGDGPLALETVESASPPVDLIVLDLMLPGMSGYSVCEKLRQRGNDIPVLMLSARTLAEDRTRGFDVGADQYLTKPFDLDELLSRINGLLNRHHQRTKWRATTSVVARFGSAAVNFATHEVTVGGQNVKMTPMELRLVRYFWENEGRVISRQELLENVWDLPGDVRTRAVDQFLRRLRKVFEPHPSTPSHFLTLRDAGYRFVAEANHGPPGVAGPEFDPP